MELDTAWKMAPVQSNEKRTLGASAKNASQLLGVHPGYVAH